MDDGAILRRELIEVGDLTSRLQGMVAEAVPLRPGRYDGTLSTFELDGLTLQVIRSVPLLILGAPAASGIGLIQAFEGAERARWNGHTVKLNEIAVCGGDRQHEAIYPDPFACMVLSCHDPTAEAALAQPGFQLPDHGEAADALHADPEAYSALATAARAIEQASTGTASLLQEPEARCALRATVLDAVRGLLISSSPSERPRARDGRTRQRIVHEGDEYLRANPARPVYTDELCAALGVSATRLHQAFSATFGISPHRYLKLRRMGMVRATLLSRSSPWRSVKAVALSYGFWHLGQFAHDYRALYGESPSETLARTFPRSGGAGRSEDAHF